MNFESFSTGSSFMHRLDARIKLLSSFALIVVIALCQTFQTALAALVLGTVLILFSQLSTALVGRRILVINGFVLFLWFTLPPTYPGELLFAAGPLKFSRDGILLAALISIKTNATVLILISLVATSSLPTLGHALTKMQVPPKLCLLLLFSYRYIHVIHQEYLRLVRAAKLRCFRAGTNMHSYRTTGYLFGMTLVKSHHRAQRVRQAMVLRGFQGQFHSIYVSTLGRNEIFFALLVLATVSGLISLEIIYRP